MERTDFGDVSAYGSFFSSAEREPPAVPPYVTVKHSTRAGKGEVSEPTVWSSPWLGATAPSPSDPAPMCPVLQPLWNEREILKEIQLLEGHVSAGGKRCAQCCTKHLLNIEALAEEAKTLITPDRPASVPTRVFDQLATDVRHLHEMLLDHRSRHRGEEHRGREDFYMAFHQHLRELRKWLISAGFNVDPRCAAV